MPVTEIFIRIFAVVLGYLLGSIPFAFIFTRIFSGKDIRLLGSGNGGANNVYREVGVMPAVLVGICDIGKGTAAVFLASRLADVSPREPDLFVLLAGLASEFTQRLQEMSFPAGEAFSANTMPSNADVQPSDPVALPEFTLRRPPSPLPRFNFTESAAPSRAGAATSPALAEAAIADPMQTPRFGVPDTHGDVFPPSLRDSVPDDTSLDALRDLRPMGQIHDSFIIAAGRDGLWIIDQHVAHERILFEKVLASRGRGAPETQGLLMPLVIQLTAAQQIEYARIGDELNSMGFDTEPFGNRTIAVKSTPAGIGAADAGKVIFEILEIAERELRKASIADLRRAIAASIACRAAIKINTRLDPAKMEWLLRELAATSSPMSCPHGRPIALRYPTRDILKDFHRI